MKRMIVAVDLQKDFASGVLGSKQALEAVKNSANFLEQLTKKDNNAYLLGTLDTHNENYLETREGKNLPIVHCVEGTEGYKLEDEINVFFEEKKNLFNTTHLLPKITFGAYNIGTVINNCFVEKPDEFVIFGLDTDICVVSNFVLLRAYFPETPIYVLSDCSAGVTKETHNAALTTMKSMQAIIITSEEYLKNMV